MVWIADAVSRGRTRAHSNALSAVLLLMQNGLLRRLIPTACSAGRPYAATSAMTGGEAAPHTRTQEASSDVLTCRRGGDDDDNDDDTAVSALARSFSGGNCASICSATAANADREESCWSSALLLLLLLRLGGINTASAT